MTDIDESGWPDLRDRLAESTHDAEQLDTLVGHIQNRLLGHFGTEVIEIWAGKNGSRKHSMHEVAAAAVAHLVPILDELTPEALANVLADPVYETKTPPPWDDEWRTDPRTAGWRA